MLPPDLGHTPSGHVVAKALPAPRDAGVWPGRTLAAIAILAPDSSSFPPRQTGVDVPYRQAARQRTSCLDDVGRWGAGEAEPMLPTGPPVRAAALPDPRMPRQGCFFASSVGAWALPPSHDQCRRPVIEG